MITIDDDKIIIPRSTWNSLKEDSYFKELIEIIEDREALEAAKKETEYFVDYNEYRSRRLANLNV